jgi:WD40 repeat protein
MTADTKSWVGAVLSGGRYEVTGLLGAGGMGFVYRATDRNLACEVVIKAPRPEVAGDAEFAARFNREVRSLVQLTHPHVVKIHDVGTHEGLPFAVLQLLSGGSLRDRARQRGGTLPPGYLKDWLPQVAAALDFIHRQRYVHRDVKPDNILFDAAGNAHLGDFGVVKLLAEAERKKTLLTGLGTVLGTPQYMAPEMLLGKRFDGRIDQYALAVTVYEMLAGRYPFNGASAAAVFEAQVKQTPAPLDELAAVSPALAAAVQRALAKGPDERFADCTAFADAVLRGVTATAAPTTVRRQVPVSPPAGSSALRAPRSGRSEAAPAAETPNRTAARTKPNPTRAATVPGGKRPALAPRWHPAVWLCAGLLGGVVLLGLLAGGVALLRRGTQPPPEAVADIRPAPPNHDDPAKPPERTGAAVPAVQPVAQPPPVAADKPPEQKPQPDKKPEVPDRPPAPSPAPEEKPKPEEKPAPPAGAEPGGEAPRPSPPALPPAAVRGGELPQLRFRKHKQRVAAAAYSPDGRLIVSGAAPRSDGEGSPKDAGPAEVLLWDAATGSVRQRFPAPPSGVWSLAFAPDGRQILAGCRDGSVRLWDAETAQEVHRFTGHKGGASSVCFLPDGHYALSGGFDGKVRLWDTIKGTEARCFRGHTSAVTGMARSSDGRLAASASWDKTVRLWDVRSGEQVRRFEAANSDLATCVAFAPDGRRLLAGYGHKLTPGTPLAEAYRLGPDDGDTGYGGKPVAETWLPPRSFWDGEWLAGNDQCLRLWDTDKGVELLRLPTKGGVVRSVAFAPDGKWALSGDEDCQVCLWDLEAGRLLARDASHVYQTWVLSVAFAPDGRQALSAATDHTVRQWRWADVGNALVGGHNEVAWAVAVSPDGKYILSGGGVFKDGDYRRGTDNVAILWDVETWKPRFRLLGHGDAVRAVAFSADGKQAATAGDDQAICLWDVEIGRKVATWNAVGGKPVGWVHALAFSPDGSKLVSGGGTLIVWDVAKGEGRRFDKQHGSINSVAFSPDGLLVLAGSSDDMAGLWNVATGEEIKRFQEPGARVLAVALAHDGRSMATAGGKQGKGVACLWKLAVAAAGAELSASGAVLHRLEGHTGAVPVVAFAPDDKRLATWSVDGTLRVWDAARGTEVARYRAGGVRGLAFFPDGRRLAACTDDGAVRLWAVPESPAGAEGDKKSP